MEWDFRCILLFSWSETTGLLWRSEAWQSDAGWRMEDYIWSTRGAVNGYKYHHKVCTGTAGFAAPEQYEGKINAATDIYTFGKTLSALCGKTDCLLFIRNMSLFWLIFRCCMKKPEMRYQNMKTVQKKLSRIQKRQNQSKIKNMLVLAGSSIAFAVITVFLLFSSNLVSGSKTFDFYEELTDITDFYYQEEFQNGSKADREENLWTGRYRTAEITKTMHWKRGVKKEHYSFWSSIDLSVAMPWQEVTAFWTRPPRPSWDAPSCLPISMEFATPHISPKSRWMPTWWAR